MVLALAVAALGLFGQNQWADATLTIEPFRHGCRNALLVTIGPHRTVMFASELAHIYKGD